MNDFVFAGGPVPGMGDNGYGFGNLKLKSRITGDTLENKFDGGDPGLNYRFWNQQEDNYSARQINDLSSLEEQAFLGLENLFACRKQCKADLGGYPSLRSCIRACKGKGLTRSALKTKEAETQEKMAEALSKMAGPDQQAPQKSNVMLWVVVGFMALVIVGLLIYFLTRKKEAVAECGVAV